MVNFFLTTPYHQNKRTIFDRIDSGPYFELRREEIRFVHGTQTLTRVERLENTEYECGHTRRVSLLFFAEDRGLEGGRRLGESGKAEDCRCSTIWAMIIDTFNLIDKILIFFIQSTCRIMDDSREFLETKKKTIHL